MVSGPVVSARPVGDYSAGSPKVCTVDGCDGESRTRGWCNAHYARWWRYGDPTGKPTADRAVDEVAVARAISGDPPQHLRSVDRQAAIAALTARGLSARQIAVYLRCTQRTVVRHRSQLRTVA